MALAYFELLGAVLLNVASYAVYKAIAGMAPQLWWPLFLAGLALGGANTFLFAQAIKDIRLSIAYPVFSGACFALIAVVAVVGFDERMLPVNILGLVLVVLGIILASWTPPAL
jgi:multidrug transporter EmrE-like cation transporter